MVRLKFSLFIVLMLLNPLSWGEDDIGTRFTKTIDAITSFSGDFNQVVKDDEGDIIEKYQGEIFIQKPGNLRWNARVPFEQTIVANKSTVWFYDKALKQVTINKSNNTKQKNPALVLSGTAEEIKKAYKINLKVDEKTQVHAYELVPKKDDRLFEKIIINIQKDKIVSLEIYDSLEQITQISFSNIKNNIKFKSNIFIFDVPKGVKVIRNNM
jgi:outer membrane lipoprotein carrier protein